MSSTTGVTPATRIYGESDRLHILNALHNERDKCHVLVPPGIGEFLWVWSKLQHVQTPLRFWFTSHEPRRAHQVCDLLGVDYGYAGLVHTDYLLGEFSGEPCDGDFVPGGLRVVHINDHLERGLPLTRWAPWLPYKNPIPPQKPLPYGDWVMVHACNEGYSEGNLNAWQWANIIERIEAAGFPVRLVGALWDMSFAFEIMDLYRPKGSPIICQSLEFVLQTMMDGKGFLGLNSGLGIMAAYAGVHTLEGYPKWLYPLARNWPTEDITKHMWCNTFEIPLMLDAFLAKLER